MTAMFDPNGLVCIRIEDDPDPAIYIEGTVRDNGTVDIVLTKEQTEALFRLSRKQSGQGPSPWS